jgi:hypothetical protein
MIKIQNCLCITGPNSSGKATFLMKMIEDTIGKKIISQGYSFKYSNDKFFPYKKSQYHFIMDCKDLGYNDKHVIYHFVDQISHSKSLQRNKPIFILKNIHLLTLEGLFSLRGIIDKFNGLITFLFTSNTLQSVPKSILSRIVSYPIKDCKINFQISHFSEYNKKLGLKEHSGLKLWAKSVISEKMRKKYRSFSNEISELRELMYKLLILQIKDFEITQIIYECALEYIDESKHEKLVYLWDDIVCKLQSSYRCIFLLELFWLKIQELKDNKLKE